MLFSIQLCLDIKIFFSDIRRNRVNLQVLREARASITSHVQSLTPLDDRRVIYGGQRVSNQLERRAKSRLRPAICERRPGRLFRIEGVVSYGLLAPILRAITDITLSRRAPECYRSTSTPIPVPIRPLTSASSRRLRRTPSSTVEPCCAPPWLISSRLHDCSLVIKHAHSRVLTHTLDFPSIRRLRDWKN